MKRGNAQAPSHKVADHQITSHRVTSNDVEVDFSDKKGLAGLIASLRHGGNRRDTGLFFVEGAKMVREALASRAPIEAIVVCPELFSDSDLLDSLRSTAGLIAVEIGRRRYENAARHFAIKQDPQGIGALVRQTWADVESYVPPPDGIMVALCSVQDAGNVGTVLRTCDAVGCSAAFVVGATADPYGPQAVKASLGAVFGPALVRTDISGLVQFASRVGATVVGTSPWAENTYREAEYMRPVILMLGNEAKGLSDEELAACHLEVSIPMVGRRDSLNVAVAGGIVLYEILAKREFTKEG